MTYFKLWLLLLLALLARHTDDAYSSIELMQSYISRNVNETEPKQKKKYTKTFIEKDINHWPILMTRSNKQMYYENKKNKEFPDFNLHLIVLFTLFRFDSILFFCQIQSIFNGVFSNIKTCIAKKNVYFRKIFS